MHYTQFPALTAQRAGGWVRGWVAGWGGMWRLAPGRGDEGGWVRRLPAHQVGGGWEVNAH